MSLAPYAYHPHNCKGRFHIEAEHFFRSPFERDRDRIIHSTAFRRLAQKTQVFPSPTNDHHRTRLTHSIEVAQIGRVVARQLLLEENLTEAIALAHDLGHPPYGHAGEEELSSKMKNNGGFEHNVHTFRIVSFLEYRYPEFNGLNLTWEVREAIAHHSKSNNHILAEYKVFGQPFLEAQVADAVDSLAYNAHDVEDALTAGLIDLSELEEVPLLAYQLGVLRAKYCRIDQATLIPSLIRKLIDLQVSDLIVQTQFNLKKFGIRNVNGVRSQGHLLVHLSEELTEKIRVLEIFLREKVYCHFRVQRMAIRGRRILGRLFDEFTKLPVLLPHRYQEKVREGDCPRVVCDYLAGMTDRFASKEYRKLFAPEEPL